MWQKLKNYVGKPVVSDPLRIPSQEGLPCLPEAIPGSFPKAWCSSARSAVLRLGAGLVRLPRRAG